jgi:hypothetical protein
MMIEELVNEDAETIADSLMVPPPSCDVDEDEPSVRESRVEMARLMKELAVAQRGFEETKQSIAVALDTAVQRAERVAIQKVLELQEREEALRRKRKDLLSVFALKDEVVGTPLPTRAAVGAEESRERVCVSPSSLTRAQRQRRMYIDV